MKRATRDALGTSLIKLADKDIDFIVLGADLSKATKAGDFASKYPDRYFECGISEMNMIGVASGLASQGNKVVISSFASFLTGRYDQLRCSIAMPKLPVLIVGTHGGLSPSLDGPTQSGYEDVSLMLGLGIEVYNPSTASEAEAIIEKVLPTLDRPIYIRLGRQAVDDTSRLHPAFNEKIHCLIMYTGCVAELAHETSKLIPECKTISVSELSSRNISSILEAYNPNLVVTLEDHFIHGGLASLVASTIATSISLKSKLVSIGIESFPGTGKPEDIYNSQGLNPEIISEKIKNALYQLKH